ncbi:hypothetical protein [Methanobrevibacter sp.]|uniref:hypothetical protein n=1 Tax=Methanobrevibacter sp. TaxID=66852 RepID=UPI003D7D7A1F
MQSNISKEMKMKFPPIVLIKSNKKPKDAKTPKTGRGGCVMSLVAQTIANRTTTCFGREHISCGGVSVGLVGEMDLRMKMQWIFRHHFYPVVLNQLQIKRNIWKS